MIPTGTRTQTCCDRGRGGEEREAGCCHGFHRAMGTVTDESELRHISAGGSNKQSEMTLSNKTRAEAMMKASKNFSLRSHYISLVLFLLFDPYYFIILACSVNTNETHNDPFSLGKYSACSCCRCPDGRGFAGCGAAAAARTPKDVASTRRQHSSINNLAHVFYSGRKLTADTGLNC